MEEIFFIFKMEEISVKTKVRIMRKLGAAMDNQMGMNYTGDIIDELVALLDGD